MRYPFHPQTSIVHTHRTDMDMASAENVFFRLSCGLLRIRNIFILTKVLLTTEYDLQFFLQYFVNIAGFNNTNDKQCTDFCRQIY